jgi:release factor glutamine methyltransferase
MAEPGNLADRAAAHATIEASLERAGTALRAHSGSAQLDAELLLAHVLQRPRSYLHAHAERRLDAAVVEQYDALLARRARGEPVAYLVGAREFWSMMLSVTPAVLVPRPETEIAVERCLALRADVPSRVVDLGTGSGAIALALASERPHWQLVATDRSAAALQIACANATRLGFNAIEFVQGEWFDPLTGRRFDLVVSNPPYVATGDPALEALRFEPAVALSPGSSGLEALQSIILKAADYLLPGAWLVLEHGTAQAAAVAQMLGTAGYAHVRCYPDLAGHDRVTQAQWPSL